MEPSAKHEVVKRADKEKRAASAAPVAGRKPEEAAVSPPLKTRKFERYVDDVPRGGEGYGARGETVVSVVDNVGRTSSTTD